MNDTPKIVGDKPRAEVFWPVGKDARSQALVRRLIEGPSEAEREASRVATEQYRQEAAAERQQVLARHAELVAAETHPVLAALLAEHAPTETNGQFICRACPAGTDPFGDDMPALAPCRTWKSIEAGA